MELPSLGHEDGEAPDAGSRYQTDDHMSGGRQFQSIMRDHTSR